MLGKACFCKIEQKGCTLTPLLLALDTSTPHAAIALIASEVDGTLRISTALPDPASRHGCALIPAIRDLLAKVGRTVADLDGLAVGLGPGSYTGLRIGITAAKTLAYTIGKSLVGLDSLEIVARNAPGDALFVSAIGDAQRGDLYAAEFRRESPGASLARISPTRVISLAAWLETLEEGALVLGPALQVPRLAALIPLHLKRADDPALDWPEPLALAALANESWQTSPREDLFLVEPAYLRRSAAEDLWEQKGKAEPR